MHVNLISEYQRINKGAWLSSGCRIPNLAHSSFFPCESGGRTRCLAGFSCPCADTKRLLIKSALADSLLIRVCGVTARAHRDRLAWSGFSPDPGKMGKRPATDGELEDEAGADITEKKGRSTTAVLLYHMAPIGLGTGIHDRSTRASLRVEMSKATHTLKGKALSYCGWDGWMDGMGWDGSSPVIE